MRNTKHDFCPSIFSRLCGPHSLTYPALKLHLEAELNKTYEAMGNIALMCKLHEIWSVDFQENH